MNASIEGTLFVVAAPSGAGKSTLVNALLEREPTISLSVKDFFSVRWREAIAAISAAAGVQTALQSIRPARASAAVARAERGRRGTFICAQAAAIALRMQGANKSRPGLGPGFQR